MTEALIVIGIVVLLLAVFGMSSGGGGGPGLTGDPDEDY